MEVIKLTNIFRELIRKQRYRTNKDPFEEFIKIKKKFILPPITKETVIITPLRVSPISNLFEGLIAFRLRMMGYRTIALMCGQKLKKCENLNLNNNVSLACSLCLSEQEKFLKAFDVEGIYLKDLNSEDEQNEIDNKVKKIDFNNIENTDFKGVKLGVHVLAAIQRHFLTSKPDFKRNIDTILKFYQTAFIITNSSIKLFKKYNPIFVLSSHGIYSMWGPIIEVAKLMNINSVVWGRGYVGSGNLLLSHNKSYLLDRNFSSTETWHLNDLTEIENKRLIDYFEAKRNPGNSVDYVSYYTQTTERHSNLREKLGIPKDKKIIAHYPNIPWDGQAFCKTDEFPTIREFCKNMFAWFEKNPEIYLIIRIHPAEKSRKDNLTVESFNDILKEFYPTIYPENLRVIQASDSITSYQLKTICEAGITYGSTLSLEFSVDGWPMIQCGLRETSNRNIVFDAFTKEAMFNYLNMVAKGELHMSEEMKKRAKQFAYFWIFKRHIPEKLIELKKLNFQNYKFNNIEEFEKNESLNWIIEKIITKKPFIWEENA